MQAAAHEANQLIDRRAFSWTDLFNQFEADAAPRSPHRGGDTAGRSQGRMMVAVTVVSRRVEDLDEFIDALEKTGAFQEVLSRQEEAQEDGTLAVGASRAITRANTRLGRSGTAPAQAPARQLSRRPPARRTVGEGALRHNRGRPVLACLRDYRAWLIAAGAGAGGERRRPDAGRASALCSVRRRQRPARAGQRHAGRREGGLAERRADARRLGPGGERSGALLQRSPAERCRPRRGGSRTSS